MQVEHILLHSHKAIPKDRKGRRDLPLERKASGRPHWADMASGKECKPLEGIYLRRTGRGNRTSFHCSLPRKIDSYKKVLKKGYVWSSPSKTPVYLFHSRNRCPNSESFRVWVIPTLSTSRWTGLRTAWLWTSRWASRWASLWTRLRTARLWASLWTRLWTWLWTSRWAWRTSRLWTARLTFRLWTSWWTRLWTWLWTWLTSLRRTWLWTTVIPFKPTTWITEAITEVATSSQAESTYDK